MVVTSYEVINDPNPSYSQFTFVSETKLYAYLLNNSKVSIFPSGNPTMEKKSEDKEIEIWLVPVLTPDQTEPVGANNP